MSQLKKIMAHYYAKYVHSEYVSSNLIAFVFFYLIRFIELGQKYRNTFIGFLVQTKTLKSAFEIN